VLLITVHGAKGLEFPVVFLAGLEEGIFPSYLSVADEDPMALEEERRLFYVGVTRAKKELYLSAAASRLVNGNFQWNEISRFVADIPEALVEKDVVDNGSSRRPAERPFGNTAGRTFGDPSPYGFSPAPEKPRPPVRETFGRTFTVVKAASLDYKEGDRVRHVKFGEGTVTKIVDGKKDYEVTVNFDSVGERVLMAGFAKLVKI
jgi:DNA helicase-2/ATP-dependent DNA helicase PcrA